MLVQSFILPLNDSIEDIHNSPPKRLLAYTAITVQEVNPFLELCLWRLQTYTQRGHGLDYMKRVFFMFV
jgi:hypothetical protein